MSVPLVSDGSAPLIVAHSVMLRHCRLLVLGPAGECTPVGLGSSPLTVLVTSSPLTVLVTSTPGEMHDLGLTAAQSKRVGNGHGVHLGPK